ncbi:MAG: isoprenylcysteine carboxylmethyltransferase family protein [Patescibacteria group bacterium]|nr:isoprenylcysteine carboxylmethyltransferase family protein [Patescibacteria group bacterium]
MENNIDTNTENKNEELHEEGMVHLILSHSYTTFLLAVVIGLILDIVIPINILHGNVYGYVGAVMIILGSLIIYWAQSTSSTTKKEMEVEKTTRNFAAGPYKYTRNPTHVGLTIMTLGLGFLINSISLIVFVIIASFITKDIFLRKEEALLEKKYGQPYTDYKKKVRIWI